MFLRSTKREKDGKTHRYWSVVWLAMELWDRLGLDGFWRPAVTSGR